MRGPRRHRSWPDRPALVSMIEQANRPRPHLVPHLVPTSSQTPPRAPSEATSSPCPLSFGGDEVAEPSRDEVSHPVPSSSPERDDLPQTRSLENHPEDCPECRQGKHANCTGWALDDNDELTECSCAQGGHA